VHNIWRYCFGIGHKNDRVFFFCIEPGRIRIDKYPLSAHLWYKPDWIKYLDSTAGLGSVWITQWKYWTGLRLQKSPIHSTPIANRILRKGIWQFTLNNWIIMSCFSFSNVFAWCNVFGTQAYQSTRLQYFAWCSDVSKSYFSSHEWRRNTSS